MKFIEDDEFILIMEDQNGAKYSLDDKKRLYDAGVRTIVHYPFWDEIEKESGGYDWESVDRWVYENRQAGLKTMLSVYQRPPDYFPEEWYLRRLDGSRYIFEDNYVDYVRVISPWNGDGWKYHLDFIAKFCERNNAPDILCYSGVMQGGAAVLPEMFDYRADGEILPTVLKMAKDEQTIFMSHPSHEIWTALHPHFDAIEQSGTKYRVEIYDMLHKEFPDAIHHSLTHTFFNAVIRGRETTLGELQEGRFPLWTGSEYTEGLALNTDEAIELGFRGFVCAPLHNYTHRVVLEDWMLDTIRESLGKWQGARNV